MNTQNDQAREWLREQLAAAGHGARQRLAKHLGFSRPDAITRMLNVDPGKETREIKARELSAMREFFTRELGTAKPAPEPIETPPGNLPYGGKVAAGYFLPTDEYNQDLGDHLVPPSIPRHPGYPQLQQCAWLVEGDSMDQAGILDGMWAVAAQYADYIDRIGELDNGNYVIVERARGGGSEIERTVKEVQFARRGMRLVPRSSNPIHKEFFIDLDHEADNDAEQVRILAVVLWVVRDMDPRSRR